MRADSPRWHEISASQFAHEREGLAAIRELLPDQAPFQAWTNFEFRDSQGKWHEIDALVLGERRLHLIELKHYQGTVGGTAYAWQRGRRTEDSPLRRTRNNAQRLSSMVKSALRDLSPQRALREVPWVQECVFLHAQDFRCALPPTDRTDLFGLDGQEVSTGLPSIAQRLLEPTDGQPRGLIDNDELLVHLFERIGFGVRREREAGSWRLLGPKGDGEGWQDWDAEHRILQSDAARIRFFVTPAGASDDDRRRRAALVKREYEVTKRLNHDGLVRPRDLVDDDLGVGLVYPTGRGEQRLDLWLTDHAGELSLDERLRLIRQLADTLKYVHRRHIVHRALCPTAITVTGSGDDATLKVGDWQFAGADRSDPRGPSRGTATRLFASAEDAGVDAASDGAYLAPEGRWNGEIDRVRLDVFALGAIAYLILAGRAPATDGPELRLRLQRDQGLDLAADVPELPPALRQVVLDATRAVVSDRLADADAVLAGLDSASLDMPSTVDPDDDDPLDALPGRIIGERYVLTRRLGSGSTAVGLLVRELGDEREPYVLKVALNDRAVQRLRDEAQILESLNRLRNPRIVRMEAGPVQVGSRVALVLESAGTETLGDVLRGRGRLSIDLLERWGIDLLDALVALDRAGIDHRDVKPANLGVREQRGDRAKHLVLFDFSLSRAGATALEAGTPPYLDPFLGTTAGLPPRPTFDSAAERYAAAVTLYAMATGNLRGPTFGDGQTDPAMIPDEAGIEPADFDTTFGRQLVEFFRTGLRRDARERFHTATEMLTAWRAIFPSTSTVPADADAMAEAATASTPLRESGLSARALSALEPLRLETVGDLAGQDPGRLTRLSGVAVATRKEISAQAKQWRERFGNNLSHVSTVPAGADRDPLTDARVTAERLCDIAAGPRAPARRGAARVLLGLDGDIDAFATLAQLAPAMRKGGTAQVSIVLAQLQTAWADSDEARGLLDDIAAHAVVAITSLGGVAPVTDVVGYLLDSNAGDEHRHITTGLLRAALDRTDDVAEGTGDPPIILRRRARSRGIVLLATQPEVLDASVALGRTADQLTADAARSGEAVLPAGRAIEALARMWPASAPRPADRTLVRMSARLSGHAGASARGELHDRELEPSSALRLAVGSLPPGQQVTDVELAAWVRARFPDLAALPGRPRLDQLVTDAGLDLRWDGTHYVVPSQAGYTTGMSSLTSITVGPVTASPTAARRSTSVDIALSESQETRSFLALGVPRRWRLERAVTDLRNRYGVDVLDLTSVVIEALRERADEVGIGWDMLTAADAAERDSKPWRGLTRLVQDAALVVERRIGDTVSAAHGAPPLLLTEPGPMARYELMPVLARLADITASRARAVWLLIPLDRDEAAAVDGRPLQLSHGGQFVALDEPWLAAPALEGDRA